MDPNLCGIYQLDKSNIVKPGENFHLVIAQRRKPTPQKPPFYLLQRISNKEHIYISSLYEIPQFAPNDPTVAKFTYLFDWRGKTYQLTVNRTAQVAEIEPSNQSPIKEGPGTKS